MSGNQPPPLTQPINILNFGPYLGQVLSIVQAQQLQIQSLLQNQQTLLQNDTNLAQNQEKIWQQVETVTSTVNAFNANLSNTIDLLVVTIAGLGDVATVTLQQDEIALLQKILSVVTNAPVSQDVDLENVFATPTNPPTKPGP